MFTARGGFPIGPGPGYAPAGRDRNDRGNDDDDDRDRDDHHRDDRDDQRTTTTTATATMTTTATGRCGRTTAGTTRQAAAAPEYPGATGEVLQGKWVTFCERPPVPA